jgi:hypothetical protein
MEDECKLAFDYLRVVGGTSSQVGVAGDNSNNHDLEAATRAKMEAFLADAAERIMIMAEVYK